MDQIVVTESDTLEVLSPVADAELFSLGSPDQELVFVGDVGIQGPRGPEGPEGPAGPAGTDVTFTQSFDGSNVTVTHNLGKYPAVTILTTAGDEVEGEIEHLSVNQLQIQLAYSTSGVVICN